MQVKQISLDAEKKHLETIIKLEWIVDPDDDLIILPKQSYIALKQLEPNNFAAKKLRRVFNLKKPYQ